ncbi:uncharacterized protein LOC134808766 isoform X2 [Pan troglodytes]|uniref:uncharacterized protein LOC134808766 isoform X2 n=1 Tax=Pan troglodytes TaxID=9598 RepID=UPI0007DBCFBE
MAKKQEELKLQSSTEKPSATKVKTEALGYGRSWAPEVHMEICQLNIGLSPPAPGSAPGANRTPFRIHSNADNKMKATDTVVGKKTSKAGDLMLSPCHAFILFHFVF